MIKSNTSMESDKHSDVGSHIKQPSVSKSNAVFVEQLFRNDHNNSSAKKLKDGAKTPVNRKNNKLTSRHRNALQTQLNI